MNQQTCVMGVDIGTTRLKVSAFLGDGTTIAARTHDIAMEYSESGGAAQDIDAIYDAAVALMLSVVREAETQRIRVGVVGISAAMHSLVPLAADNTPLSLAMTWLDRRATDEARQLQSTDFGQQLYLRTGVPVHAMTPLSKIKWLAAQHPQIFSRAARFVSIKEYLWYRWFHAWEVDVSMAGATGFFNLARHDWDAQALAYAGIHSSQLSRIVDTRLVRQGTMEPRFQNTPLERDIPFCVGSTDGLLATWVATALKPDVAGLSVGTSLAVRWYSPEPAVDSDTRVFCYPLSRGSYVVGAPSNNGGIVLDWMLHHLFSPAAAGEEDLQRLLRLARDVNADRLFCVPYISGERAPFWNDQASMSLVGLTLRHRRRHIVRATVEGILFNAYWIWSLTRPTHRTFSHIVVSGRLFSFPWIAQICADLFGLPLEVSEDNDQATLGAALWAANAGEPTSFSPIPTVKTMMPHQDAHTIWMKKYAEYRQLCQQLKVEAAPPENGSL